MVEEAVKSYRVAYERDESGLVGRFRTRSTRLATPRVALSTRLGAVSERRWSCSWTMPGRSPSWTT
jgi:hypothetical protein